MDAPILFGGAARVLREYPGVIVDWTDGDTAKIRIFPFRDIVFPLNVRVYGINAPEKKGATRDAGVISMTYAGILAPEGRPITYRDRGPDKYGGRELGDIILPDGRSIADEMIRAGHAKSWLGEGPRP